MTKESPETRTGAGGVYVIVNLVNEKRYVGSAVDLRNRRRQHWQALAGGLHCNRHLQSAWNKYGAAAFVFRPLLVCAKADLILFEQRCMDGLRPEYNLTPRAASNRGFKFSPESLAKLAGRRRGEITDQTRAKWSAALRERTITPTTRAKLAENAKGNKHRLGDRKSPEERAKISTSLRGRKLSPEHRAKLSAAHVDVKLSADHRAALSKGHLGSEKARAQLARLAISNRGRKLRPEEIAARRAHRHTDEAKAKMSVARLATIARKGAA